MSHWKRKLYLWATGKSEGECLRDPQVSSSELLYFLWKRGGCSWIRGFFLRFRFRSCGKKLFVGKNVEILFPKQIRVGSNVSLGDYSYLNGLSEEGMFIGNHVRIRERVWIQATSLLDRPGKGLVVGDNTYIGPGSMLGAGGGIRIGRNVILGASVDLLAEDHDFSDADRPIFEQGVTRKGIVLEDDVWIGNRAIVLDGVRIGQGAVLGAGSVLTKDLPSYSIAVGNPARVVGHRKKSSSGPEAPH